MVEWSDRVQTLAIVSARVPSNLLKFGCYPSIVDWVRVFFKINVYYFKAKSPKTVDLDGFRGFLLSIAIWVNTRALFWVILGIFPPTSNRCSFFVTGCLVMSRHAIESCGYVVFISDGSGALRNSDGNEIPDSVKNLRKNRWFFPKVLPLRI